MRSLAADLAPTVGSVTAAALGSVLEARSLDAGQILYREGALPPAAWAIRAGSIELTSRSGGRRSVVQVLRSGGLAGDVPILLNSPSLTTARVRDGGAFLKVGREDLRALLAADPELARVWMFSLARRLERTRIRLLELLGGDLRQSVARVLVEEATDGRVHLTQAQIAEMLGVQRTSVNRVVSAFRAAGLVRPSYGLVQIVDRERLEAVALAVS